MLSQTSETLKAVVALHFAALLHESLESFVFNRKRIYAQSSELKWQLVFIGRLLRPINLAGLRYPAPRMDTLQMMSGHKDIRSLMKYDRGREKLEKNLVIKLHYDD